MDTTRATPGKGLAGRREGLACSSAATVGRRGDLTIGRGHVGAVRADAAESAHASEQAPEHLLELLWTAEVVLDALEHAGHQLLELGILRQLFLEPAQLAHELLHLHFLRDLHQHGLGRRRGDHLHLLADHLEPFAGHAGALVLAAAEARLQLVEFLVDPTQVNPGLRSVAHDVIVVDIGLATAHVASSPGSGIVIRRREASRIPAVDVDRNRRPASKSPARGRPDVQ